ncbi:unnamed protein product [Camellia sinensis]
MPKSCRQLRGFFGKTKNTFTVYTNSGIEDISILVSLANPNNLSQPDNFSVKLEKKLYEDAATKSDFMSRICQKIMPMESLYYHGSSAASSSSDLVQTTRTETAGHGSSLQNMSAYSHEPVGNLVGPSTQSSIFANIHRESPRSQPLQQVVPELQHQQLRQQLFKQKVQQPHIQPSLMQPNIQYSHHQQQDQQILSLPIELQYSQQPMFTTVQDQQQTGQRQNATILQQNHHVGLLEKKQQLPSYQQNMSTPFNQSLGLQSNVSGLQQQKQFIGARSDMLKRQPHQHALNVLQQPEVAAPQQSVHQTTQPMQLHQLMGLQDQRNSLQESMQKRHHNSVALLPQNGFIDQQKQTEQSQRVLPQASSASLDSTCQIECAALADWHDQGYRELESVRDMYLTEVIRFYKRIRELCLQPPSAELATKYEKTRIFMEKTIKFLEMPRADIVRCSKDKFYHYLKLIISYVNSFRSKNTVPSQQYGQQLQHGSQSQIPQLQQQINMKLQFHSMSPGLTGAPSGSPQLAMQQRIPNSQANKINLLHNGSLTGSEPKNAWSPLQHGSTHQNIVSRPQQTNIINALHSGSLNGMEQRSASGPLRHGAVRSLFPNMMSTVQQTNFSHMTTVNALDPTTSSLPSSSTNPFLNLKQEHKHQTMQAQTLQQPMQQPLIEQKKQLKFMQKIYEVNEPKVGRVIGFSSGVPQQYHSVGQQMEYSPQYFLPSTPHMNVGSPQTSQHSSPHIDQKNLLSPLSRAGTPLQSAASPFVVPSPSTPLTPSSLPLDPEIHSSGISPLSVAENTEHPQTPVGVAEIQSQATIQNQFLAIGTPEISVSPLLAEFNGPEDNHETSAKELSFKCLLEAVKSVSPKALSTSVRDIGLVINTIDRIAGTTTYDEFGVAISDDLAANISHCLQGRNFSLDCEGTSSKRKRHISTTASDFLSLPLNENDGLERLCCQTPDVVSNATSRIKRPRIELNDALLDEIKEINQKLVETVIDVISDSTEYAAKGGFGEGTIVRCSYSALGLGGNFKQQYSSSRMLSILPVQLLVPADYPNSSPILVNTSPIGKRDARELENLSERARLRFSLSLCELSQPMSLGEMARTWDVCARTVLSEFAQSMGGGSFSTTYGTWENCITAS